MQYVLVDVIMIIILLSYVLNLCPTFMLSIICIVGRAIGLYSVLDNIHRYKKDIINSVQLIIKKTYIVITAH